VRSLVAVVAALTLVAACGIAAPATNPPRSLESPSTHPTSPALASPARTPDESTFPSATATALETLPPLDPAVVGLTCGDDILFHPALLSERGQAERDLDPAAAALRRELAGSPPEADLPATGWIRVAQLPTRVRFVAPGRSETGWVQFGTVMRDGVWQLELVGQCRLQPFVPPDVTVGVWWLDPQAKPPARDAMSVSILLNELACSSGRSPEGRVLPPAIVATPETMTVTILVRRRPGGNDCQGTAPFPMVLQLPEALGLRRLLDGGSFPPRDASVPMP
jgi:hypothetical protein